MNVNVDVDAIVDVDVLVSGSIETTATIATMPQRIAYSPTFFNRLACARNNDFGLVSNHDTSPST